MTVLAKIVDSNGNPITTSNPLAVVIPSGITLSGAVEITNDVGSPIPISASALPLPSGAATETTSAGIRTDVVAVGVQVAGVRTDLGTDGASPPSIAGTGVRGWLRSIYDTLRGTLTIQGTVSANVQGGNATAVKVDGSAVTQPVSVGNFPTTQNVAVNNFPATQNVSVTNTPSVTVAGTANVAVTNSIDVDVLNFPATQNVSGSVAVTGTANIAIASGPGTAVGAPIFTQDVVGGAAVSLTNPVPVVPVPATLAISQAAAAAAANTITLPAAGAGLFHYIDAVEITLFNAAARTGSATPVTVTSTNLPGGFAVTFGSAGAIGVIDRYILSSDRPLRSVSANTATTIVCPAATGVLWRVNVIYSTGP